METSYHTRRLLRRFIWLLFSLSALLAAPTLAKHAQDSPPTLLMTDEQEIGFRCPAATALQPGTDILWVLMDNCGGREMTLEPFDRNTGTPLVEMAPVSLEMIDPSLYTIDRFINPMGFTPDNVLEIVATDYGSEAFARFRVDLNDGTVTQDIEADEQLNALLRRYSEYPVFLTTLSADHQLAAVSDEVSLHLLDLSSEEVLLEIDAVGVGSSAFSNDGQHLYVNALTNPDDYESFDGTLSVYSLTDGELLNSLPLAFSILYPSDSGRFLAVEMASFEAGDEQIGVVDLETGSLSEMLPISESPQPVTTCRNDGRDISDANFMTTGELGIRGLHWLADDSGFVTLNSPGMQSGGVNCYLDVSRFRTYSVSGG